MKSASAIEKMKRGPVGLLTVLPSGPPSMGKNMVQWFLYCVVISIFAAYLSGRLLAPGTAFLQVFRVIGTVAFLGYGAAHAQESIWSGRSWVVTLKHLFDSVIYALLTAAIFGWLWPKSLSLLFVFALLADSPLSPSRRRPFYPPDFLCQL